MSLPLEDFESVVGVIAGSDVRPPRDTLVATPRIAAMEKLQRLHATAGYLAETSPEIIANPEAARGLEQALIEAAVGCLTEAEAAEERSARGRHELVVQRFYRMMEAHPRRRPLHTAGLQGNRGRRADFAHVLLRSARNEPKAIPAGTPHEPGVPGIEASHANRDNGNRGRNTIRLL